MNYNNYNRPSEDLQAILHIISDPKRCENLKREGVIVTFREHVDSRNKPTRQTSNAVTPEG